MVPSPLYDGTYNEAKRSSTVPKKTMGLGSRMLSFDANCSCSSCRSMIEGCLNSTLLIVEAADVEEVMDAYEIREPSEVSLEVVDLRRREKGEEKWLWMGWKPNILT